MVRLALLSGAGTWTVKEVYAKTLEVAKMRMLTWMCAASQLDKISHTRIREMTKVKEKRLIWFGQRGGQRGKKNDGLGSTGDEEEGAGQSNDGRRKSRRTWKRKAYNESGSKQDRAAWRRLVK